MPRESLRSLEWRVLAEEDRYVDIALRLVPQDAAGTDLFDADPILEAGGRWDRATRQIVGEPETGAVVGLHPGQLPAARWIAAWFAAKARGEELRDEQGRPYFSVLFHGGRRAGKTDLASKAAIAYALQYPSREVWLVSENIPKTQELEREVRRWLPDEWYSYRGLPYSYFRLPNGSEISLRSAHDPEMLKRGRCDFAVLNEAQNMSEKVFATVRPATADNGGLTLLAANPPDTPTGMWVESFFEEARARKRGAAEFHLVASANPHVNTESLLALKDELDERTYRREILGEFLPRVDTVFHSWSNSTVDGSVRPVPELGRDVTSKLARRFFRRDFDRIVGMDFQKVPYPCAVEVRAFEDPANPDGEPLLWYTDVTLVDLGDEEALSDALVAKGYDPARTAVVADASGDFQGIDRKRKERDNASYAILNRLGWKYVFRPDENQKSNPSVIERHKAVNGLLKNANGVRRLFSSPECLPLNVAMKSLPNKHGKPDRHSPHAHLCDAASYVVWRMYPRTLKQRAGVPVRGSMQAIDVAPRGPRIL